MPHGSTKTGWFAGQFAGLLTLILQLAGATPSSSQTASTSQRGASCPADNGGITLPKGFCATIFADGNGHARQLAVAPGGTVYMNTWSGVYFKNDTPPAGGFLVALKDTKSGRQADVVRRFGETFAEGGRGGTGIALYQSSLYAEINDRIVRYPLRDGAIVPGEKPETIVSAFPLTGDHPMHPFAIDTAGNLFVDLGSATNACEVQNRMPHSPGHDPCVELETRGGIWRYDANRTNQRFSPKERFATGLRNGEGFDFDAEGRLFVTQHGRDQLHEDWPNLYSAEQAASSLYFSTGFSGVIPIA